MDKKQAYIALGIRDEHYDVIPVSAKTEEQLRDYIAFLRARHEDHIAAREGEKKALLKRLHSLRKAKVLANKRADRAEAMMRKMLDDFAETAP